MGAMQHRWSTRCVDRIRRYQASEAHQRAHGACRFDPTCSSYALQAFEQRTFLVALAMTCSRLLRCNPLVRRFTSDPVRRPRHTPRPGTVRSLSVLMLITGVTMVVFLGATASADPPTGGCTGSANGRPAATITKGNPLKVKEHTTISAEGSTPPGKSGPNHTSVKVWLVDPIGGLTSEDHEGNGDTWSSSTVNVDDYLKYGVGTYKVEVTNTGAGWSCTFVGYIQLDGNPLTKPVGIAATGMIAIGAVGGLLAPRRKPNARWVGDQTAKAKRDVMDTILDEGTKITDAADAAKPPAAEDPIDVLVNNEEDFFYRYCLGCVIAMILLPAWAMPIFGMGGGAGALTVQPRPSEPVIWKRRVWRRGHPIVGFFSGLVFGLGATVLLWQYNVWLLDIVTAIVVPVVLAILFAVYAWIGKPFQVVAVRKAGRVDDEPPPPPAAVMDEEPPPPAAVDEVTDEDLDDEPPPPPAV